MADTALHSLTEKTALAATDEFYLVQSPYGSGDDRRTALSSIGAYFAKSTLAAGALSDSAPMTLTQTWDDALEAFTGYKINITNTNSAASSLFADYQIGGTSVYSVRKDGAVVYPGTADQVLWYKNGATLASTGSSGANIIFPNPVSLEIQGGKLIIHGSGSVSKVHGSGAGVLRFTDSDETDFNRVQFGGTTSSFPALKRSTTFLQARLADDSAYADFACRALLTPMTSELTIATGAITVTGSYHRVDTEADAASDDLDTINGGVDGMTLTLRAENDARTVVVKDGTGNIQIAGDMTLDNTQDTITLMYDGTLTAWLEIGRAASGA